MYLCQQSNHARPHLVLSKVNKWSPLSVRLPDVLTYKPYNFIYCMVGSSYKLSQKLFFNSNVSSGDCNVAFAT